MVQFFYCLRYSLKYVHILHEEIGFPEFLFFYHVNSFAGISVVYLFVHVCTRYNMKIKPTNFS